jgi:predicted small lipoprotein YifL
MGAIVVSVSLLNTACGLKAPLYLPDEKEQEVAPSESASKRRVIPRPAPQAPKQDRIDAGKSQGTPAPTPPADPDRPAAPPPPPGT